MKKFVSVIGGLIFVFSLSAQNKVHNEAPPTSDLDHSIFFIGDIGESDIIEANIKLLKVQMNEVQEKGTVVLLGNTISKKHLKENDDDADLSDPNLLRILNMVKDFKGEILFIPGEKEWEQNNKHDWEALMNLEEFVENYLGRGDVFLPSGGCPGPVEIELTNEIVLLVVDSQWWLHLGEKPESECGFENSSDFLILLSDAIKRNRNKKIVFAAHHPLYSGGKHGGNFPFPGPVELYRKWFGTPQDFAFPYYKQMRKMAKMLGQGEENIITVGAHDNSLQFTKEGGSFFIVSGSGSKSDFVSEKKMDVAIREVGFSRLNFYSNNEVWLEFWAIGEKGNELPHLAFQKKLYTKNVISEEDLALKFKELDFSDSTIIVPASKLYATESRLKKRLLGDNYRKEWTTPIKVPVFDIGKEKGGLKIVQRGGGQQTRSLRLEAKDGKQYVLRSVEKYTERAIPEILHGTFAAKIVQDGISESYPYAAIAVPKMAAALGVFHSNPKIVYVPDDPRLGMYQDDFKNELFLFEERAKGNLSDADNFGNSENIIGSDKLIEKRYKNADLQVDETAVLRARLFDIFLNDWDRHDDQWRWATFEKDGKTIVQPIPRDRDQVFFYGDGVIPWLSRRKWAIPKFQPFDTLVENVVGLGFNARYFDRSFLQSKTKADWIAMAEEIKSKLTDQVIEQAIKDLPKEVYQISGDEIIRKLKARRELLPKMAGDFYQFLAKEADVVGTNADELFEATWKDNGDLDVKMYRLSKKGNKKEVLFNRIFLKEETKEVRIYGLNGKDQFEVKGNREKGVVLRIIGGKDKDKFRLDNTIKKNLVVYDKPKTKIEGEGAFTNHLGKGAVVNTYDRKSFKYNMVSPGANLNFVSDDGLILGTGVNIKTQSFRKEPFGSFHKFLVNYAFMYPSLELKYSGEVVDVMRGIDFLANVHYNSPNFQGYYYGLGNTTQNLQTDDNAYNRIRMGQFFINPKIRMQLAVNHSILGGVFYQQMELKATPDRFVTDFSNPYNDLEPITDFNVRKYWGLNFNYSWDTRNNKVIPSRGVYCTADWSIFRGINSADQNFQKLETDLRFYTSFGALQRSILAVRVGAAHNTDGYSFFQANKLGLKTNLRGYSQDRFAGDDMVYQNTDFRLRLARFQSYFLGGEFGILGFNDFGRVWVAGENSNKWHHGYGGGFWVAPFKLMVLTANFSHSTEDNIVSIEFKYLF